MIAIEKETKQLIYLKRLVNVQTILYFCNNTIKSYIKLLLRCIISYPKNYVPINEWMVYLPLVEFSFSKIWLMNSTDQL